MTPQAEISSHLAAGDERERSFIGQDEVWPRGSFCLGGFVPFFVCTVCWLRAPEVLCEVYPVSTPDRKG